MRFKQAWVAFAAWVLCFVAPGAVLPVVAERLVLGTVHHDIRKEIQRFTPLAAYLENALTEHGVTDVSIAVLPDSRAMAAAMRNGDVDIFFDSPLVAARVAQLSGAQPLLQRWKQGMEEYHSMIIVPQDSPVQSLADLAGRTIGFEAYDSTSGFMLPVILLGREGLYVRRLGMRSSTHLSGVVDYVFTGDHRNTVLKLTRGLIDAAATDSRGLSWLERARPGAYRLLAFSDPIPRHIVMHRRGLDDERVTAIAETLLAMEATVEGVEAMHTFHGTLRFTDLRGGADAAFAPIQDLLDELNSLGAI